MHNDTAYAIMVFSPAIYWQLLLNIRYTIVYTYLRSKHSKTYLKKHSGSWISRVFFHRYKHELGKLWYHTNVCLVFLTFLGTLFAIVYLLLWIMGYAISIMLIPYSFLGIDIACIVILSIINISNRLKK